MATWSHAVFTASADAQRALQKLAAAGVSARDIEVRSSIPHHGLAAAGGEPRTNVPKAAILGGILGGTGAFLLASLTSLAYPLPTGGMPIVALPPSGIITFEGTAIGAILLTVATVLYEGDLLNFRRVPRPLDSHLAAGNIIVSVRGGESLAPDWAVDAVVTESESA